MLKNLIFNSARRILTEETPKPLGRWGLHNYKKNEIKGTLANIDSCGGDGCGDVLTIKNAINCIENQKYSENSDNPNSEKYYIIDDTVIKF